MTDMIPLARPNLGDEEVEAASRVLRSGMLVQGTQVARFEQLLAARIGLPHAVAVASGTSALELGLEVLGIGRGDEVLCPDLTWPSPAHAVLRRGARPVLVDVHPRTWNATADDFRTARTPQTRAAIVIHQFGFPAETRAIQEALPGVMVLEDAACAIGSTVSGRPPGGVGHLTCLSFHPRKVVTTGEGGACLTADDELANALRILRNHGQRERGVFAQAAGNHRLHEMAGAVGAVQLGRLDEIVEAHRRLARRYRDALPALSWQEAAPDTVPNYQTMGLVLPASVGGARERDLILAALREKGVQAGILSYALHRLGSIQETAVPDADFPHTSALVDRGMAVPLYATMSESEQDVVIGALTSILSSRP